MTTCFGRYDLSKIVKPEGFACYVLFDETHKERHGLWLCRRCGVVSKDGFCGTSECPLADKISGVIKKDDVYILGPEDTGESSPFGAENIQKIIDVARQQFHR